MSVHHLDLRGADADEAVRRVVREFGEGTPLTGSDRALVLDETGLLVDHGPAYLEVFTSGRIRSLVCVVCGPPSGGGGHRILERPGQLGPERDVATLWVSNETGVDWGLRPRGTARPHPEAAPGSRTGVERLVEALLQAEVFDRVVELSRQLPEAAASPGLSWTGPEGGDGAVAAALARTVHRFTDAAGAPAPPPATGTGARGGILVELVEDTHRAAPGSSHPGSGELAAHEHRLRDRVAAAEGALDAVSGLGGAFSPASPARVREEELSQVGGALLSYRDHVASLLSRLGSLNGGQLASELARAGLGGRSPGPEEVDEAVGALVRRVDGELERGEPVTRVAAGLDRIAERLSPRGSASALPRVQQAAPDHLVSSLSSPPPFPLPGPLSWLLPVAFLLPLLPALTGGWLGLAGATALALGWVAALAAGLRSARGAEAGAGLPVLAVHAVAAFAGGFTGMWAGGVLRLDLLLSLLPQPLLLATALLTGAALGAYALLRTWAGLARRWRSQIGLERAGSAASALTSLVNEAAQEEWYPGTQRRHLADAARAAASAARAVADALSGTVGTAGTAAGPSLPELEAVLRSDMAALTRTAMGDLWNELRAGGPVKDPYEHTRGTADDLMQEYRSHLERMSPHTPPRFADSGLPRRVYGASGMEQAMRSLLTEPGGRMLQLCDPKHLHLLSDTVSAVGTVRFAPRSLREQLDRAGAGPASEAAQSAVWTHGGRLAGLVRLVPLRPGVVRTQWFGSEEPDGANGTGASPGAPSGPGRCAEDTEEHGTGTANVGAPPSAFEEDYFR
ncbi:hypothetical protein [Nocardiopsis alborubida]|uniref:Uncharacterized protein n=1 Tax=Nocardiopsis alborubida TaxID=146802 RepID=A0A7X6RRX0_9ACTN|nr:hypothetical protein [Nocardiopsis alborubida]NKZ00059.1 hypothetical protein [Nocardiopsis alborubida]